LHAYVALRDMLTVDLYQLLAQWWDDTCSADSGFFTQMTAAPEWFDKPVSWRNYALFKINLNAPDDLILKQCRAALAKARGDQQVVPAKRCFTTKDFHK